MVGRFDQHGARHQLPESAILLATEVSGAVEHRRFAQRVTAFTTEVAEANRSTFQLLICLPFEPAWCWSLSTHRLLSDDTLFYLASPSFTFVL